MTASTRKQEKPAQPPTSLASDVVSAQDSTSADVAPPSVLDGAFSPSDETSIPEAASPDDPNPVEVDVYPLRTYQDAGELKRRGGPAYSAPRLHAKQLIAAGLATDKKPKA
ncbi:hypothetical protein G7009_01400 [Pseudomonas capeferrum]|uniref:hypothetical protein n=1 Tax=Pseudomonas capeferrum TaxID=1495066 RepID=UPI0015E31343|nr:hypothetical protein [Pseudomonas capeferrum]MBA1200458.1 hypothetical protein [Pseudomonas capeferrum]